jgi:DNA-binding response OmpR family regulator
MKILIIEDEREVSIFIAKLIESWGHSVESAGTGKEGLCIFKQGGFDLILLDIFLPDIKGYELIPDFKTINIDVNIVAMTGHNSRELELKVRAQGIIYYMVKPWEIHVLKSIVDYISGKSGGMERAV